MKTILTVGKRMPKTSRQLLTASGEIKAVIETNKAVEAFAQFRALLPHCVYVDTDLKDMPWQTFVKACRLWPGGELLKILVVSATNRVKEAEEALAIGADTYMARPFTNEVLVGILQGIDLVPPKS